MIKQVINTSFIILSLLVTQFVFGQNQKNDTIFLEKDTIKRGSPPRTSDINYTFIDPNSNSKFYKYLVKFKFGEFDRDTYNGTLKYLKDKNEKLIKRNPDVFATKWVHLETYKNHFYVYCPCDFYNYFGQSINDTTFIDWTGEGPYANKIVDTKVVDSNTYIFQLTGEFKHQRTLIIHIIDRERGIAVFEENNPERGKKYNLMIAADKIKMVPMVLTHCYDGYSYFQFDKPDFKKLLRKR